MMTYPKQHLPVHFLKFGVDNHGVIVPILRLSKAVSLRSELATRAVQPKWKGGFKSE